MNNLISLTKINLLANFNFKKKKNKYLYILLFIFLIGYFGFLIYQFFNEMMKGFVQINATNLLLALNFLAISSFVLFTSIYKINGIILKTKDYDLLMSLPIKRKTIITSKIASLYLFNFLYSLLFLIPGFIAYINYVPINFSFCFMYFITSFIIPLIPTIIATFIGIMLSYISSLFKAKNLMNIILSIAFLAIFMYFSSKMDVMSSVDLANLGESLIKSINNIYPFVIMYMEIVASNNILSLLLFALISFVLFSLFMVIVSKIFVRVNNNLINSDIRHNYKLKTEKTNSPLKALIIKEIRRYFSSANYVMNTAIGGIMLTLCVGALVFFGGEKMEQILDIPGLTNIFKLYAPLAMALLVGLANTTPSSISLEGKHLWIMKSIPVEPIKIFIGKIAVNLIINMPILIINSIALCLLFKTGILTFLLCLIYPFIFIILTSMIGIFLNLKFPNFEWTNELKPIKQSLPTLLSMVINILLGILPILFIDNIKFNTNVYIFLMLLVLIVLNILMYVLLKKKGFKLFNELS